MTIMKLCLEAKQRPGPRLAMGWWEHEGLDLEGMWTAARDTEQMEEEEDTDGTENTTDD